MVNHCVPFKVRNGCPPRVAILVNPLCMSLLHMITLSQTAGASTRCQGQGRARAYITVNTATNERSAGQVHPLPRAGCVTTCIFGQLRRVRCRHLTQGGKRVSSRTYPAWKGRGVVRQPRTSSNTLICFGMAGWIIDNLSIVPCPVPECPRRGSQVLRPTRNNHWISSPVLIAGEALSLPWSRLRMI